MYKTWTIVLTRNSLSISEVFWVFSEEFRCFKKRMFSRTRCWLYSYQTNTRHDVSRNSFSDVFFCILNVQLDGSRFSLKTRYDLHSRIRSSFLTRNLSDDFNDWILSLSHCTINSVRAQIAKSAEEKLGLYQ